MVVKNKKVKSEDIEKGIVISFYDDDYLKGFDHNHDDLIITAIIVHNYVI